MDRKISLSPFVLFILFTPSVWSAQPQTFQPRDESEKLNHARVYVAKIAKRAVKTIQSPTGGGDIIDCVPWDQQPASDHPLLKDQKLLKKPPSEILPNLKFKEFQHWRMSRETCPENTIPILRVTVEDIMRSSSLKTFGRKTVGSSNNGQHEYAVAYVIGDVYSGAAATINVWAPKVENPNGMSVSQIWLTAGDLDGSDLNTIEAGWQIDSYNHTGCYNLLCSGFVQTDYHIALGAEIAPASSYNSDHKQFDIELKLHKETGGWWLKVNNIVLGYWPSNLFTHLRENASMVQFGGEIASTGSHYGRIEMRREGYAKASFFRNLSVFDSDLLPISLPPILNFKTKKDEWYTITHDSTISNWDTYFFYRVEKCKYSFI